MFVSSRRFVAGVAMGLIGAAGSLANANPVTYSFSHSITSGYSASTEIKFVSDSGVDTMVITLTNTMELAYASIESRALTGLFFDIVGDPSIGTSNVEVIGTMVGAQGTESTNPTDYWAFREDLHSEAAMPASFGGARYGLGAAGFGVFELEHILGTPTASNQPNGIDGGILSSTGVPYLGPNQTPLIRTSAIFTFELASEFLLNYTPMIENVSFQFGSGFNEQGLHLIPLPGTAGLAMVGCGLLAIRRRRNAC